MSAGDARVTVEWLTDMIVVAAAENCRGAVLRSQELPPSGDLTGVCAALADDVSASQIVVRAQPGLVIVDGAGCVAAVLVGDEPDTEPDAGWLTVRVPGRADGWIAAVGSVPRAQWMLSKLSYVHRALPDAWASMAQALTPQAWLVQLLTGEAVTDVADAVATGAWANGGFRLDLLSIVDESVDWTAVLPVVTPGSELGRWLGRAVVVG